MPFTLQQENGITAQTTDEWLAALRLLTSRADIRKTMGHRGRETVERKYSIQANYPVLRDALMRLTKL